MLPRDSVDVGAGVLSKEDKMKVIIDDVLDKLPEEFNIQELMSKVVPLLNIQTIVIKIIYRDY